MKENETMDELTKEATLDFIRMILLKDESTDIKDHYRFEMSGYENLTGQCTIHNIFVLNKFAHLGIYDFTNFLSLDFYKGSVCLYFEYFGDFDNVQKVDLSGYGTTEIIYQILLRTVYSGKPKRRRS